MSIVTDRESLETSKAGTSGNSWDINWNNAPAAGALVTVTITAWYTSVFDSVLRVYDNQGNGDYNLYKKTGDGLQAQIIVATKRITTSGSPFINTVEIAGTATDFYAWAKGKSWLSVRDIPDVQAGAFALNGSTELSVTSPTTLNNSSLIIAACCVSANDNNINVTQLEAGWTNYFFEQDAAAVIGGQFDYQVASSIGAFTSRWGFDAANAQGIILAFPEIVSDPFVKCLIKAAP